MANVQRIVVVLLIIAIIFSAVSIGLNMYVFNLVPVRSTNPASSRSPGTPAGNVELVIETNNHSGESG